MPPCPFRAINHQLLNPTNPSPTLAPYQPFASFVRLKTAPNRLGFPGRLGMKKETVSRLSVSLPPSLLRQLDQMSGEKGYHNRSLAIADMIRDRLVEHRQKFGHEHIAGTITLVYDHHKPHLQATLTGIQHDHHNVILSTVHVHLDHHNCLEVLLVRGKATVIRRIADELLSAKGVKHGKLTVTTTGKNLPS